MQKILVDNKEINVDEGASLLRACLDNGIYIPNLCFLEGMDKPSVSCRMCFVEIQGEKKPVTSCAVQVQDGMVVKTDSEPVRQLQRAALELLLSVHHVDCGKCPANKKCELQRIAKFLKVGLKPKRLEQHLKEIEVVEDHPLLDYFPNRCVLCGKCVFVCRKNTKQACLTFAKRGFDTVISFYGENDASGLICEECNACVDICPVGALKRTNKESGVRIQNSEEGFAKGSADKYKN
ncbi:MAG: (4Fe-4S)-binding protein [Desulfobacterales bacterium]|nr:(4Fe-4S)-binding protein [Desulfobacterales bacterium]